ncbi:protein of unknown function [Magnetospirillum gryphiswaldense MSR-1 v2]|uniref:Uncharacterized protein n=1 Tax=Magnetospirillum gryphiswaldense (strain DSM 6361 / JCM 21280 / NBRC 15271 / MSR-1) TaxID=431944 RepID=V6F8A9_MAGGM|nr:protein of unknown function [Magnetospirillum gryphiswaldense MSR-1 v2]
MPENTREFIIFKFCFHISIFLYNFFCCHITPRNGQNLNASLKTRRRHFPCHNATVCNKKRIKNSCESRQGSDRINK